MHAEPFWHIFLCKNTYPIIKGEYRDLIKMYGVLRRKSRNLTNKNQDYIIMIDFDVEYCPHCVRK